MHDRLITVEASPVSLEIDKASDNFSECDEPADPPEISASAARTRLPVDPARFFSGAAKWIWSQEGTHARRASRRADSFETRLFRKEFHLEERPASFPAAVSADGRYELALNGRRIGRGPAKGDVTHQFFDIYDLAPHLQTGKNVLAIRVIDYSPVQCYPPKLGAPASIMTWHGALAFDGWMEGKSHTALVSDESWRVQIDESLEFVPDEGAGGGFVGYFDRWHVADAALGWQRLDYCDDDWLAAGCMDRATRIGERRDEILPYGLTPSLVDRCVEGPPQSFQAIFPVGGGEADAEMLAWAQGHAGLRCEAGQSRKLILDAGRLETGFPRFGLRGGEGGFVRITYAEALRLPAHDPSPLTLRAEGDLASVWIDGIQSPDLWTFDPRGKVSGFRDVIFPDGRSCVFEPTHWRTFRYVMVEIAAGSEAVCLDPPVYATWLYPLNVRTAVSTGRESDRKIWEGSVRTLHLCAHETFEDCPYYEQIQYAGDSLITSRLMLYLTGNAALTRQAITHFAWSITPEGITASRYPCRVPQVIPSWSLHWVSLLHDYTLLTGDRGMARSLLPTVERVLAWFDRHADEDGLPSRLPHWNCVDWTPGWQRGQPPGWDLGPTCVIACQYVHALREAARLHGWCGDETSAARLRLDSDRLGRHIDRRFWCEEEGCYRDSERLPDSSVLTNAWAVCARVPSGGKNARVARRLAVWSPANVSYFGMFWVFRALRILGHNEWWQHLHPWEKLIKTQLSTWPEDTAFWRSLCHAWSAHPILEYLEGTLGLTVDKPGWSDVTLRPNLGPLQGADFRLCTPLGDLHGYFRKERDALRYHVVKPAGLRLRIVHGDEFILLGAGEEYGKGSLLRRGE